MAGAVIGSTVLEIAKTRKQNMGGAVIGSTIKEKMKSKWGAVNINTSCNLNCPFCYLGKKPENRTMTRETSEILANYAAEKWEGVAIIGTEPLLNEESVEIANIFARRTRTHIITNCVNLSEFAEKIKAVRRIDISLDGGPETYCRSKSFEAIAEGAGKWKNFSDGEIFALHVLSAGNCRKRNIEDMLRAGPMLGSEKTVFSPFIRTIGGNHVEPVSLKEITKILSAFSGENWILIIDPYHALIEGRDWDEMKIEVSSVLSPKNLLIVDFDPGDRIDRVDIDGLTRHPFIALHPGIKVPGRELT